MVAKTKPRAMPPIWPRRVTTFLVRGEAAPIRRCLRNLSLYARYMTYRPAATTTTPAIATMAWPPGVLQGRRGQVLRLLSLDDGDPTPSAYLRIP